MQQGVADQRLSCHLYHECCKTRGLVRLKPVTPSWQLLHGHCSTTKPAHFPPFPGTMPDASLFKFSTFLRMLQKFAQIFTISVDFVILGSPFQCSLFPKILPDFSSHIVRIMAVYTHADMFNFSSMSLDKGTSVYTHYTHYNTSM